MKIKKAKEMFEKLGYKIHMDHKHQIVYVDEITNSFISFSYENKYFTVWCMKNERVSPIDITVPMLKAINEQVKELGWE